VVLAVKKLREEKCKFRVLGLSATPGSNNESIQVWHSPQEQITVLVMFSVVMTLCIWCLSQLYSVKAAVLVMFRGLMSYRYLQNNRNKFD